MYWDKQAQVVLELLVGFDRKATQGCPCGYYSDPNNECSCIVPQIQRYHCNISGPLMDRIDIHREVPAAKYRDLASCDPGESSSEIKARVNRA